MNDAGRPTNQSRGMLPPERLLTEVLPTDRLLSDGRLRPPLRAELRRIPNVRNALSVLGAYVQTFGVVAIAVVIDHPVAWVAAFLLMGRAFQLLGTLAHEAAHRLLFSNKRWNDFVGSWLLGYPAFLPTELYRGDHISHHRHEFGPDEPDRNVYDGYPITRASMRRKLTRDLFLISGWKNAKALLTGLRDPDSRIYAVRILVVQAVLFAGFAAVGRPELYLFLWLLPWLTVWRVITRLRLIAEHGGLTESSDRRMTTHHVRQSLSARFWMVPYNLGWHLAHHVDMGIPFRKLPQLHRELVAAGWISPDLQHSSYLALWWKLASRPSSARGDTEPRPRAPSSTHDRAYAGDPS